MAQTASNCRNRIIKGRPFGVGYEQRKGLLSKGENLSDITDEFAPIALAVE
jgi:hypothetical protein